MRFSSLAASSLSILLLPALSHADPVPSWIGSPQVQISRATSAPCEGESQPLTGAIAYDSWARTRATVKNICFEAWVPGVTDVDGTESIPGLQLHYRFHPSEPFATDTGSLFKKVSRRGNNHVYALSLTWTDPFYPAPRCLNSKVLLDNRSGFLRSTFEFFVTLNGKMMAGPASAVGGSPELIQVNYASFVEDSRIEFFRKNCNYEIR